MIASAPAPAAPVLLDVTRLVAQAWSGRQAGGLERVCSAYWRHFRSRARLVVQHRGVIRVLDGEAAAALSDLLGDPPRDVRARLTRLLAASLVTRPPRRGLRGAAYLNPGDTDFDLPAHHRWTGENGLRAFYLLHDLIPARHPEWSRPHAVRRHRGRVRGALTHAAGIILASEAVRHELVAYAAEHGLRLPPLTVAHLAGADLTRPPRTPETDGRPYFLCVGTIEPRKNHRLLLAVWERLIARLGPATPRLLIVGKTGPLTGDLLAPLARLHPHVEHRPACRDADLAVLMQNARALLMPSLAEGFGLPVVEALQAGTPVIASTLPVFGEIGQGAACLLDPHDIEAWEQAIIAAASPAPAGRDTAPAFVPPTWRDHFDCVERFIASPVEAAGRSSERVPAA
jgi:glycosyltransferase involved in cell wall biosynthesis